MSYPSPAYSLSSYPPKIQGGMMYRPTYKLKVEGIGSIDVQPDRAEVILGVFTENVTLRTAQEENTIRMAAVLNALRQIGVSAEDIITQSYTIHPQYDYIDGRQVFRGYRVNHIIKITIRDMDNIGVFIDTAVESGANIVQDIQFTVSNLSPYYQQALRLSIEDATEKAITIGRKLNVTISPTPIQIIEKSDEQVFSPRPVLYTAAEVVTPIQTGQIKVTARIEAIFAYN